MFELEQYGWAGEGEASDDGGVRKVWDGHWSPEGELG